MSTAVKHRLRKLFIVQAASRVMGKDKVLHHSHHRVIQDNLKMQQAQEALSAQPQVHEYCIYSSSTHCNAVATPEP